MYSRAEILTPRLIYKTPEKFKVYQNVPNPFLTTTIVGFMQPKGGEVKLSVFDVNGKEVYRTEGSFEKGYHEFQIKKEHLNTSGVLFYKVDMGSFSKIKKMILIN